MKITRTKEMYEREQNKYIESRDKALKGCDVCPCCGERDNIDRWYRRQNKLFVGLTIVYTFECNKCRTKWESESFKDIEGRSCSEFFRY